jgi:RNA polymerase sigma-70 factor (ECF subfamily)
MERHEREWLRSQMTELADGNRAVFDGVFERAWPLVRGFVGRHLPPADADDAAQEALLSVFARASEFDRSRDALAWILGIAAWEIRTARTRRRRRREEALDDGALAERPDAARSPEEAAAESQTSRWIDETLASLEPGDEATLRAYMTGDRPGVPPATFRKRVQRAVSRLRSAWKTGHGPRA